MDYAQWRNFTKVLDKAKLACMNSGFGIEGHSAEASKMVEIAKWVVKKSRFFYLMAAANLLDTSPQLTFSMKALM